jgi:3-dehydro-L-gulonate 2-dehydrogenase
MGEPLRLRYDDLVATLDRILQKEGMADDRARRCALLFADASRDGVPSHGLNRFALMVRWIREKTLLCNAPLTRLAGVGGLERWDGGYGPGPWNAWTSMERAIHLARDHGIGCVALRHTNHWMRAGNYGWQAANAGLLGLCWTNTIALMPAWSAATGNAGHEGMSGRRVGNNPLVLAVPRAGGHVVLDMAMSQYSMGKLTTFKRECQSAPLPAGFDKEGRPTHDPAAVLAGGSAMPIGAWKGSGLAMLLDMTAALLAGGLATHHIRSDNNERGVSQVFIAIHPQALGDAAEMDQLVQSVIAHVKAGGPDILYPGERSLAARAQSDRLGVPVDPSVWETILAL